MRRSFPAPLLPPRGHPARGPTLALLALAPFACGLIALCLGQDANWDLRNYHWYNAWAFWTGRTERGVDLIPSQSQFFSNPLLDLPYYLLAAHFGPRAAAFALGCLQGLNFPLLFLLAHQTMNIAEPLRKAVVCAALAALGLFGAVGISELGCVQGDNLDSLGILLSSVLVLRRLDRLPSLPAARAAAAAFLCGFPAGVAAGLKLSCAPFAVGGGCGLLAALPNRRGFFLAAAFGAGAAAGFGLSYGFWGWFLWKDFANPFFPLFNQIFASPFASVQHFTDYAVPEGWKRLLFPFLFGFSPTLAGEVFWQDWRVPMLYALALALPVALSLRGAPERGFSGPRPSAFLGALSAAGYALWIMIDPVYRYLLPVDMLAPLLIVVCIGFMPGNTRTRVEMTAAVLLALAVTIRPADWGRRADWTEALSKLAPPPATLLGGETAPLILMAGPDAYAYLAPEFPADAAFVRIDSRSFPAESTVGLLKRARERIAAQKGPLHLFIPAERLARGKQALAVFGLTLAPQTCRELADQLSDPRLDQPEWEHTSAYPRQYKLSREERPAVGAKSLQNQHVYKRIRI